MTSGDGSSLKNKEILSESLKVGDIIELHNDEMVPADVVIISTEDPLGQCYISTQTLDGEQNLKPKLAPAITQAKTKELIGSSKVTVKFNQPEKDIYKFVGELQDGSATNELELKQFIPRGSVLKYSHETQAVVVYTGVETKLVLNQGKYSTKVSKIMFKLNLYMVINICTMFL